MREPGRPNAAARASLPPSPPSQSTNPKTLMPQRGRAYKPSSRARQSKFGAFASVRLNGIDPIVQNYCVLSFGEKKPPLGDKAECSTCDAEPSHDPAGHSPSNKPQKLASAGS